MKTYVLTVSQKFPARHQRAGELTNFPDAILQGSKIHTIRANYELWKKRIDEVSAGAARLSVRVWTGKPYNSPQREITSLDASHGVGVQKLDGMIIDPETTPKAIPINSLAKNDGLSVLDFLEWFKDYDLAEPMAVIHFTPFRYNQ